MRPQKVNSAAQFLPLIPRLLDAALEKLIPLLNSLRPFPRLLDAALEKLIPQEFTSPPSVLQFILQPVQGIERIHRRQIAHINLLQFLYDILILYRIKEGNLL